MGRECLRVLGRSLSWKMGPLSAQGPSSDPICARDSVPSIPPHWVPTWAGAVNPSDCSWGPGFQVGQAVGAPTSES